MTASLRCQSAMGSRWFVSVRLTGWSAVRIERSAGCLGRNLGPLESHALIMSSMDRGPAHETGMR